MGLIAEKIEHILREQDIRKASVIFDIDEITLRKLNDKALLNAEYIRETLIKYDYNKLIDGLELLATENKAYTYPEATKAVCNEYGISRIVLNKILNSKRNSNMRFCVKCGKRIMKSQNERTNGLCEDCFANSIDL